MKKNKGRIALFFLLALSTGCSLRQCNEKEVSSSIVCSGLKDCIEPPIVEAFFFDDLLLNYLLKKASKDNLDLARASLQVSEGKVLQKKGWGAFDRGAQKKINRANLQALEAAYDGVWRHVASELAKSYISLRGNQQLLIALENNLTKQKEAFFLTEELVEAGFVDSIVWEQGRLQLLEMEAQKPLLLAAIDVAIQRIAVLVADQSEMLLHQLSKAGGLPEMPENWLGFSAVDSLSRRPDIRQAENELLIAKKVASLAHTAFFSSKKEIKIKEIRALSALYNYENIVLKAREEVNNNWSAYHSQAAQNAALASTQDAACTSYEDTLHLYESGFKSYIDVIDIAKSCWKAQELYLRGKMELLSHYIALNINITDRGGDEMNAKKAFLGRTGNG